MSVSSDQAARASAGSRPANGPPSGLLEARADALRSALNDLEHARLARVERLRSAERKLARAASQRLAAAGRGAVRQIELDRQRLGRELHTGVGQMLTAVRLQAEIIQNNVSNPPPAVRAALERISAIADEALDQVRGVARRLHPPAWQRLTLDAALRQLCEMTGVAGRFETILRIQPLDFDPGVEAKSLFYRAAQEALSNVIRHSKATRIRLNFQKVRDRLVLQVRDNGIGFQRARAVGSSEPYSPATAGMGLESLREQARALGGKLLIQSGQIGTTLEVSVKVQRNLT